MKIRVGFSTTNSLLSRTIRWFTKAQVSHCFIRIYSKEFHVPLVIHADYPGVIFEHADLFDSTNIVIEEFEIEDDRLHKGFQNNLKHLRKKYDWPYMLHWALMLKLSKWFKRKVRNPLEDPKRLLCVDLVIRILNDSGLINLPIGHMHPKDLRQWVEKNYQRLGWVKFVNEDV